MATMYNPWRGCHKYSSGCKYCYIHKSDFKKGINTDEIVKTKDFTKIIDRKKNGEYKVQSGLVYLCFNSDFLIEEADEWRSECFNMIKQRSDLTFLFLTKRIERLKECLPDDWGDGYDNVVVGCTIENQEMLDYRLPIFKSLQLKHKCLTIQPLIGPVIIGQYLDDIELVVVGGESDPRGRVMDYDWVLSIRDECLQKKVNFSFRQCSTNFIKDKKSYKLNVFHLARQAREANIDLKFKKGIYYE